MTCSKNGYQCKVLEAFNYLEGVNKINILNTINLNYIKLCKNVMKFSELH